MKTILVPVDFSDNSKNAMDYAILLANKLKMKLLLLHTFHPTVVEAIEDSYKIATHKEVKGTPSQLKNELNVWRDAVMETEKGIQCEILFEEGELVNVINNLLEEKYISLVVMGTKGASGLKEVFMGSNASAVIENASCPVIAVPAGYQFGSVKKIVFATDYHDSDIASIRYLIRMATVFNAELNIVHIAEGDLKPRFEENLLEYFTEKVGKSVNYPKMNFYLLNNEKIDKSLNEFVMEHNADLLAVATRNRIFTGALLNRGLTKKMAHHIQIPLMAFHAFEYGDNFFL